MQTYMAWRNLAQSKAASAWRWPAVRPAQLLGFIRKYGLFGLGFSRESRHKQNVERRDGLRVERRGFPWQVFESWITLP